jgi:hypothetical protein
MRIPIPLILLHLLLGLQFFRCSRTTPIFQETNKPDGCVYLIFHDFRVQFVFLSCFIKNWAIPQNMVYCHCFVAFLLSNWYERVIAHPKSRYHYLLSSWKARVIILFEIFFTKRKDTLSSRVFFKVFYQTSYFVAHSLLFLSV